MEPRNGEEGHAQGETAEGRDESPETLAEEEVSCPKTPFRRPAQATEASQGREGEGPTKGQTEGRDQAPGGSSQGDRQADPATRRWHRARIDAGPDAGDRA
jgi:hypothetical protein